MTAAELKAVAFKDTAERMMTLGDLCDLVAGRVPLVIEVKSQFDGDRKLVHADGARCSPSYRGPAAGMSFDPDQVLALREHRAAPAARHRRRSATMTTTTGTKLTPAQRDGMLHLRHGLRTAAAFRRLSGSTTCRRPAPWIARNVFRLPAADLDGAHAGAARRARRAMPTR